MGTVTDLKDKAAAAEDLDGFEQKTVTIRGKDYTFRELSAGEYDDMVEKSKPKDSDIPDSVKLLRWMIVTGSVDPKMSPGDVAKLPMGVVAKISDAVNELHFGPPDLTPFADRLTDAGWTVEPPESEAPKEN